MAQCISISMTPRTSLRPSMFSLSCAQPSMTGTSVGANMEGVGGGVRPSLALLSAVSPSMRARGADPMMFTYCPVNDLTSAQGMGGWNDDMGWDDDIGWKD